MPWVAVVRSGLHGWSTRVLLVDLTAEVEHLQHGVLREPTRRPSPRTRPPSWSRTRPARPRGLTAQTTWSALRAVRTGIVELRGVVEQDGPVDLEEARRRIPTPMTRAGVDGAYLVRHARA
jgi:hypothetical protein